MIATKWTVVATTTILMGGVAANEASHGAVSEGMGMGHHHLIDGAHNHCDPTHNATQGHCMEEGEGHGHHGQGRPAQAVNNSSS